MHNDLGYIHKRSQAKVLKTPNIKVSNDETSELYFHNLLYLFMPWRNEKELKCRGSFFESYNHAISACESTFDKLYFNKYDHELKRTNAAIDKFKAIVQDLNTNDVEQVESKPNEHTTDIDVLGVFEYPYTKVDNLILNKDIEALNKEQKDVYYRVTESIEHQSMHHAHQCTCNEYPKPLRLFCSGVAGSLYLNFKI